MNPLGFITFSLNLYLILPINKADSLLNKIAFETINMLYPTSIWTRIYTNRSKLKLKDETRAGIYTKHFFHYFALHSS